MARQLELLSPARNYDIGIAAIDCGADAVYIAGPAFGARQAAGNSIEDIRRLCDYAHKFGARVFITLNTILYEGELEQARKIMHEVEEAGADALIVQDLSVLKMAAEDGFGLPLHASTQCAIRTVEDARFYAGLGFSRIVLERELSLDQIRAIRAAVDCEIEVFVHGALCVCYSGQCWLSEHIAGRSANRGACIQACRSRYDLLDENGKVLRRDKPLLSLKDLCLLDRLEDLAETGVDSFKIEGRLKNISYVRNVVRAYSQELDKLCCRASFGSVSGGFTPDVNKTFNRGYTSLFIDGVRGQWNSPDAAKSMGEPIGTISSVNPDGSLIRISPSPELRSRDLKLHNGDGFAVVRGSEIIGFRGDVCDGLQIKCKPVSGLRPGMQIYRNLDTAFEKELENSAPKRLLDVRLKVRFPDSDSIVVSALSEDGRETSASHTSSNGPAQNKERMISAIASQLSKTTDHYRFSTEDINLPDGAEIPFLTAAELNGIRRKIAVQLSGEQCLARPLLRISPNIPDSGNASPTGSKGRTDRTASTGRTDTPATTDRTVTTDRTETDRTATTATYRANISNSLAKEVYEAKGIEVGGMAYELEHQPGVELMRTKYCIRHELGICPKQKPGVKAEPLYLLNNGRRLTLKFDCGRCEMTVS